MLWRYSSRVVESAVPAEGVDNMISNYALHALVLHLCYNVNMLGANTNSWRGQCHVIDCAVIRFSTNKTT